MQLILFLESFHTNQSIPQGVSENVSEVLKDMRTLLGVVMVQFLTDESDRDLFALFTERSVVARKGNPDLLAFLPWTGHPYLSSSLNAGSEDRLSCLWTGR